MKEFLALIQRRFEEYENEKKTLTEEILNREEKLKAEFEQNISDKE